MLRSVHASQHSSQSGDQSLGSSTFYRLGKFLGIKTGAGAASSLSGSKKPGNSNYSKLNASSSSSSSHFLSSVAIPSSSIFCSDGGKSSTSSDATFVPNCSRHRPLNHSISAPTMYTTYQSPSESSTRSPTPVDSDISALPMTLALRTRTLPEDAEEKKRPVSMISPKPDFKRRWRWRRRKEDKSSRSPAPFLNPSTIHPSSDPEKPRPASSPVWDATFEPTPPLSSIFPSIPNEDLQLTPINSLDSTISEDVLYREKPSRQQSRRQSINKLARTLGVFANDFNSPAETGRSPYHTDSTGRSFGTTTQDAIKESPGRTKLSLTTKLTTLPTVLRSPSRTQLTPTRSRSRVSLSTLNTDDVHRFGLGDDLSDSWGEMRNDSRGSVYSSSYSPISPITFKPPTPVATVPSRRSSALNLLSADKVKPDEVTLASSSSPPHLNATLNRSRSLSFAPPPRIGRLAQLASAHSAASSRSHTPVVADEPSLPVKAHWLETPAGEEEVKARTFVDSHPEYADEYRNWSGQWNQDDMQQVIRMLRNLK